MTLSGHCAWGSQLKPMDTLRDSIPVADAEAAAMRVVEVAIVLEIAERGCVACTISDGRRTIQMHADYHRE